METIRVDAIELLAIVGKCKQIQAEAIELEETGMHKYFENIEKLCEAITDVVIEAAKEEYGEVEA
ncbi:MAG: hypothetical protein ACPF8W_00390 [Luminiphilus sp.]